MILWIAAAAAYMLAGGLAMIHVRRMGLRGLWAVPVRTRYLLAVIWPWWLLLALVIDQLIKDGTIVVEGSPA